MNATDLPLRRGYGVEILTDLATGGQTLRNRRGTVHDLGSAGSVFVCTCGGHGLHAHNCPVDMPLARHEVRRTSAPSRPGRGDAGHLETAVALGVCLFGGLLALWLVSIGQSAMCDRHDDRLRYCPGYTAEPAQ